MRSLRRLGALAAACFVTLLAVPAVATTVVRQSVESLIDQSEFVVHGVVERVELRAPQGAPPFMLAFVRVQADAGADADTNARAPRPGLVPVRLPGGVTAEGLQCAVAGTPTLSPGDELVMFLSRVPESATLRPTVMPPSRGRHAEAVPAGGPQPRQQWQPVALSLGTWRVVHENGQALAAPDAAAGGLHQVGEAAGTAPGRARVDELLQRARERKAGR